MEKLSLQEKLAFGIGDAGCNFVWSTLSFFLVVYLTDSVGMAAATVGTIVFLARLLDGFSDLTMGAIIDKTDSPKGKARPWIIASAPFLTLGLIALFNVPSGLSDVGTVIYVAIAYTFVTAFAYTAVNLSYSTLISLITDDQNERTVLTTFRFIFTTIAVVFISVLSPRLVALVGYGALSVIYGLIAFGLLAITYFFTSEKVKPVHDASVPKKTSKENLRILLKNKYFWRVTLLFVTVYSCNGLIQSSGMYFAKDVLGDANLFGVITLLNTVPALLVLFFLPSVVKKFGKWKIMLLGLGLQIIGAIILWGGSPSLGAIYLGVFLRGLGNMPVIVGLFAIVADIVDYGEWKTGERVEGLTFSATSFGMKVGAGLGTALVGWLLAVGHYVSGAEVQSEYTVHFISIMYTVIPIIITIMSIGILSIMNLDKNYAQIKEDLDKKRA